METLRYFREDNASLGRSWFFRFSPAQGVDVWTGEKWNPADSYLERLFTDPDFEEVPESSLGAIVANVDESARERWARWDAEHPREHKGRIPKTDEIMYAGRNVDEGLMMLPDFVEGLERTGYLNVAGMSQDQRRDLTDYTGGANKVINEELRRAVPTERALRMSAAVDAAVIDLVDDEGLPPTVWRGMKIAGTEQDIVDLFPVGGVATTVGLTSTTLSMPTGLRFSTGNYLAEGELPVVMEITAKRGASVQSVTRFPDEHEIVLPNGSDLRITGIEQRTIEWSDGYADSFDEDGNAADSRPVYVVTAEQL